MGFGKVGPQGDGLTVSGDSPVELALLSEGIAEVGVCFGIVGLEGDGPTAGGDGLVEFAFVFQDDAEIAMPFGIIGVEGNRLAISRGGLVELIIVIQSQAQVGMKAGDIWCKCDGLSDQFHGNFISAQLMCNDSQQMKGIGVAWFRGQDPPVEGLCLGQARRLVVLDGKFKGLLDGHGSAGFFSRHQCRHMVR